MDPQVEAVVLEMRPVHRSWGARRIRFELGRQMDVAGGFLLADGTTAKALTGPDDHSRFCVSAALMARERTRPV